MARSEQPSPVVLDATVLSNFAHTDDLGLLDEIPARFVTVEPVKAELQQGVADGYEYLDRAIGTVEVIAVEEEPSDALADLDRGETYVLQAALETDGTAVTDDGPARGIANALGIPLTGSVGLMIRLVRDNVLSVDEADAVHERWVTEGRFRSHVASISEAIADLENRDHVEEEVEEDGGRVPEKIREAIEAQIERDLGSEDDADR